MVTIENLTVQFNNIPVINNFNAEITQGEKVVFTGESGTGKTTLINAILGFIHPQKGTIKVLGKEMNKDNIRFIRNNISFLPQEMNPPFEKVRSTLFEPFSFRQNKEKMPAMEEVKRMLHSLGLPEDILSKEINEISGGQKQRIFLATAFLLQKPIIILDEPTTGLDDNNIEKITDWMARQKNTTILATSHNKKWIECSDRKYNLEDYGTNN